MAYNGVPVRKNFSYGELWPGDIRRGAGRSKPVKTPAYKITSNKVFLEFLHDYGYEVYLDEGHPSYAYTDVTHKRIVLNSNYPDSMLESFLKHELGHLMLFNVNQFTTVRNNTMRSIIAKELYTAEKVREFGFKQLLYLENIIQDIVIETVSNGQCVCHGMLQLDSHNAGVKHLSTLENVGLIAREVCENALVKQDEWSEPQTDPNGLAEALAGMLKDLKGDIEEIKEAIENTAKQDFEKSLVYSRQVKQSKLKSQAAAIDTIEKRKGELSPRLQRARELVQEELDKLEEAARNEKAKAEEKRERALNSLKKKLASAQELADMLQEELSRAENAAKRAEAASSGGEDAGESAEPSSESNNGEVDKEIHVNTTDHLTGDDAEGGSTHTYDCGLPHHTTVKRDESHSNERLLVTLDSSKKIAKITVSDEDADNQTKGRMKLPENEVTYFKSSKKEFDETDMIKGKRRLRMSGVNVLIGLDVSGSMTSEWGEMFTEMSTFINGLKDKLDIENIYYFTYHHALKDWSADLNDLTLTAGGGNAFGFVYQQMMQTVPVMQRNEIILVTDCGDNLGFKLSDVCEVTRKNEVVENHISIIDTEGSGFYVKDKFDEKDWSLHHMNDQDLYTAIKTNVERLIER